MVKSDTCTGTSCIRDRSIFTGIQDREMSGMLGRNNWLPSISKSLKAQNVNEDITPNTRPIDAEGQIDLNLTKISGFY